MKGVVEMLCLMKIADVLICSVIVMLISTQTVFGLEIDFTDSAVLSIARGIGLVIFVKVLISLTGSGLDRLRNRGDGAYGYGGDRSLRKAQRAQNRANKKNKRSKVYGGYDSNGVAASFGDKALEAVIDLGYGIGRAGAWVGKQITKPIRWFKNRASMAKDLVVASQAPTADNIAKAGGTVLGGLNNERKILMGTDAASKRKTESLKAKQEKAKQRAKENAREMRENQ